MALILRIFKRLGILILILILIYAVGRPTQIWLDGFYSGFREPYLQMMSSDAVTLRWQSKEKFTGVVRYGLKQEQLNKIHRESGAGTEHETFNTQRL